MAVAFALMIALLASAHIGHGVFVSGFALKALPTRSLGRQPCLGSACRDHRTPSLATAVHAGLSHHDFHEFQLKHAIAVEKHARPSFPGWKRRAAQLDDKLTEWVTADEANRPIICEYEPDALWLWKKWRGTVLAITVCPVIISMALCMGIDVAVHTFSQSPPWFFLSVPPPDDPVVQDLLGINGLWEYLLTLATFILTFFTSEAYKHWRTVYFTTRAIQGRINDVCMLVTMGAERDDEQEGYSSAFPPPPFPAPGNIPLPPRPNKAPGADPCSCPSECTCHSMRARAATSYTDRASTFVRTVGRYIKLSHTFFWAATPTCSNGWAEVGDGGVENDEDHEIVEEGNAIGPLLLSEEGLAGLVAAEELTGEEKDVLLASGLPPSQYTYILLEWVGLLIIRAFRDGTLRGGAGLEDQLMRHLTALRADYFSIGDYSAGRMPLAYVQLVQVLVDSLLVIAPFALYPELGSLSIPLTGLLTLFYKGLLELSKSFLDPFGTEGYPGQNIRVDVLVSELNFGAASRWVTAAQSFPAASSSGADAAPRTAGAQSSAQAMGSVVQFDRRGGGVIEKEQQRSV